MQLKWKVENWVFMQTLIMNTSLFTSGTLTRTHFLWMGDCFDSILREQFFLRFVYKTVQCLLGIYVRDF